MAAAMLFEAHGTALRYVCEAADCHLEGLSQAARQLKLSSKLARQLRDLEV
jgi:hypothetical protein